MDLATAVVVVSSSLAPGHSMAAPVLTEEVALRTGITWQVIDSWPRDERPVVWLGLESDLATLPRDLFPEGRLPAGGGTE